MLHTSSLPTRAALLALSLAALTACEAAQPTDHAASAWPTYDIETFSSTVSYSGTSVSPDGRRLLVTSNATGVFNCWSFPLIGGEPTQLTHSTTDAIRGIAWLDDDRFLYTADQGGNELNHVYVGTVGGAVVDLTPGESHKAQFVGLATDRSAFFVATNEREPRAFDVYRYSVPTRAVEAAVTEQPFPRELVFENSGEFGPGLASDDLRFLTLERTNGNTDSDVFVIDFAADDKTPRLVTEHDGKAQHDAVAFDPDRPVLYYATDADDEFRRVFSLDLDSGARELVVDRDWDVRGIRFTRDGKYRVVVTNADARTVLEVTDRASGDVVELPELAAGRDVQTFETSTDGAWQIVYAASSTSPADLWVGGSDREFERRTRALPEAIDESALVAAEVVRFPSFDGLEIPAILYRPKSASAATPVPAMLWIHGGPGGQSRTGYRAGLQHLVNHGYAVLMVNNRGSSGYGKTFYHLDDRKHGEDDLQDCVYGRRWLEGLDWVDADRIGIMGGSYGGYMVAAALAFTPDAFDVGVDIFGVTNWVRTLKSIPPWWGAMAQALYDELGDPRTDEERLRRISPLFHADKITKPLLVIQGANDPRVLQVESDELVNAVRANGVPVDYVVFPDEGHGFRNRKNSIASERAILAFLDKYLAGKTE